MRNATIKSISLFVSLILLTHISILIPTRAASDNSQNIGTKSGTTGDCVWTLDSEGTLTISGNGEMGEYDYFDCWEKDDVKKIVIKYGVTSIGDMDFYLCSNLKEIIIPNSVTSIGYSAFGWCQQINNVTLPSDLLTIEDEVFYCCEDLRSIDIPKSVSHIGNDVFYGCTGLINISVDKNNNVYDSRNNCNSIIETKTNKLIVGCKSSTIPFGVLDIGDSAFEYCKGLENIIIPDSVKRIGNKAFWCCNLNSITIPNSVTSVGSGAFGFCEKLKSITLSNNISSLKDQIFYYCESLTSISLPNSVTSIGESAFLSCLSLKSIIIPEFVTNIGKDAFVLCPSVSSISVDSNNLTYDSRNGCNAIIETKTNILITGCNSTQIPESVTTIGESAFDSCFNINNLTIPNNVIYIKDYAFDSCRNLKNITIPNSTKTIGELAFDQCWNLESIIIPDNVTYIGEWAFRGCNKLTIYGYKNSTAERYANEYKIPFVEITPEEPTTEEPSPPVNPENIKTGITGDCTWTLLDDTLTINGNGDMHDWSTEQPIPNLWTDITKNITKAIIKNGVLKIGARSFENCKKLTSLSISNSVTCIGADAFYGCTALTNVIIPESTICIGEYSFYGCKNLTSITIPENVTNISDSSFFKCDNLTIYGYQNTFAQIYANKNNIPFVKIERNHYSIGDVNGDNSVDVLDATMVQKYAVEKTDLSAEQKEVADVNGDSVVDILDATDIQKFSVDKITSFKSHS